MANAHYQGGAKGGNKKNDAYTVSGCGKLSSSHEDNLLIDRIRDREDHDAFSMLVTKYQNKVWRLARGITRSDEDAEDVAQEVFLTIFTKLDTFEGRSSFSSWLYRIAANASYMKIRSKKSTHSFDPEEMEIMESRIEVRYQFESVDNPEDVINSNLTMEKIHTAIEKLPPKYRNVIVLRDIEGFSTREVADMLGLKITAVKSRLHRARLFLQKRLFRLYESEILDMDTEYEVLNVIKRSKQLCFADCA